MRHHDLDAATADLDPPFAVVDAAAYEANAHGLVVGPRASRSGWRASRSGCGT